MTNDEFLDFYFILRNYKVYFNIELKKKHYLIRFV